MNRDVLLVLVLVSFAGCRQDMHDQPRFEPMEENTFFKDHSSMRPQVPGTIARDQLREDRHLYEGKAALQRENPSLFPITELELKQTLVRMEGEGLAETFPYRITRRIMKRGRERFEIFCAPCHGKLGDGRGIVVRRGFRGPPSYHTDRLRRAPVGHFFDAMTHGVGAMEDFADRVSPRDRWAITAYIRALQFSQHASPRDLPEGVPPSHLPVVAKPGALPAPRIGDDLAAVREAETARETVRLNGSGWIDQERKIVHIPITRAIHLLLERGLPVRQISGKRGE